MKTTTDAFFAMGKTHTICQDYARASEGFATLSDGCSSSPDTDIGARLICLAASLPYAEQLDVREVAQSAQISPQALDATSFSVWLERDMLRVHAWGDGIIVARTRDGTLRVENIAYPSGAPLYANYLNDEARFQRYRDLFGARRIHTVTEGEETTTYETGEEAATYRAFSTDIYDLVLVGSDGWLSGQRPVASGTSRAFEAVPLAEVVAELTAFKSMTGEFLQRRCRRILQDWAKKGWHFYDDVSAAGLYVEHPDG